MGLAVPVGYSLLFVLVILMGAGALFGAAAWQFGRRYGRRMVFLTWLLATPILGSLYTARVLYVQRSLGFPADGQRPLIVFAMFSALIAFALGLPALSIARRLRYTPTQSTATVARAGAGLALGGVFLALLVALVLDLSGILAAPIR